ncbi:YhcN/YlaJ family sporulation lipoprotein [Siminovitchia sp. 179-K 8D1 HS]|uniref:YhcN/YlaJ family sporulation lipoprotein n=1 Tax=Siminovitchia sp. 179-K 8D1 HS TaxID=3142385 RepID=UPI0039A04FDE
MKKFISALAISGILLSACGVNDRQAAENNTVYKKSGNTVNRTDRNDLYNGSNDNQNFGFVRQVKSPVPGESTNINPGDIVSREQLANQISKLTVGLPQVNDNSVVVTDKEVLIAYQADAADERSRAEVAEQVKKTAESAVPQWFGIYVTDDPALRQYVENIASMTPNRGNTDKAVRDTVKMMKKNSPQGRNDSNMNQ